MGAETVQRPARSTEKIKACEENAEMVEFVAGMHTGRPDIAIGEQ